MEPIENRLRAHTLRQPPEALRERVLAAVESPRSREWKKLVHTLQGCAVALVLVLGWCLWYEQGSAAIQQECRLVSPVEYHREVARQMVALVDGEDMKDLRAYLVAQCVEVHFQPESAGAPS